MDQKILLYLLIFGTVLFVYFYFVYIFNSDISNNIQKNNLVSDLIIADIYVINLDRSTTKWALMQEEVKKFGNIPVKRWKAIDGKLLSNEFIKNTCKYGVYTSEKRVPGEVGCYLSHKTLLEHLLSLPVSPDMGHLILEDDAIVDNNFIEKWKNIKKFLPLNWEMMYFGIGEEPHILKIENIKNGIGKLVSGWGTHGYMVRHSTIPKILQIINIMSKPIDIIYLDNFKILNAYVSEERLIRGNVQGRGNSSDIG
jgi:GR25 family glycosyltransferase involved in LPS biosynthesis